MARRKGATKAAAWKAWVHTAVQGGAGAAHRYAKPLEALRVASVADADGTPRACRAALLAADHAKWAAVWGASAAPPRSRCEANQQDSPEDQADIAVQRWLDAAPTQQLPPLTIEEVRAAAQGFKLRTSTPDGWHPRHIALLPLPLLQTLVGLFHAAEATGDFGPAIRLVVVPLITAKRRPIGLYSALVRVWAAARKAPEDRRQWPAQGGVRGRHPRRLVRCRSGWHLAHGSPRARAP